MKCHNVGNIGIEWEDVNVGKSIDICWDINIWMIELGKM